MTPQSSANPGNRVRESWLRLGVPRRTTHHFGFPLHQRLCRQSNYRVQPKQCRCRAPNRQVIPLPLRLYSQMGTGFFKGHFHCPSPDKPREDLLRRVVAVRREQGLRVKLAHRITNQQPADSHRRQPRVIPDGRVGANFDLAPSFPIPVVNLKLRPLPPAIIERRFKGWSARAFQPRTPLLSWFSLRSRSIERRIESQSSNQTCTL